MIPISTYSDTANRTEICVETQLGTAHITWQGDAVCRFAWLGVPKGRDKPQASNLLFSQLTQSQQELVQDVTDYAAGLRMDFSQVPVIFDQGTPLQQRIWEACQKIPYGEVVTYGELATLAGRPGAARAVGSTMSKNQIPIIVPCHRVIAAGNKIGGFTNPAGIRFKQKLLELEAKQPVPYTLPTAPVKSPRRPK